MESGSINRLVIATLQMATHQANDGMPWRHLR